MMDFGIIDIVVSAMEDAEKLKSYSGNQKKEYVLRMIEDIISPEAYEKYGDLLPVLIDFIIAVSKNKYVLNINLKKIKKCFSCIS